MADGSVAVWDSGALLRGDGGPAGDGALLSVIERHGASVRALAFNPHATAGHLLAAGSADGDVSVINLEAPGAPTVASPLASGALHQSRPARQQLARGSRALRSLTFPPPIPPAVGARLDGEVTALGWNSSVPYILATALAAGSVVVWDLKESKPWCTLRDAHRASVSDLAWNPEDGLYLVTASDDDLRPVLKVRRAAVCGCYGC